MLIRLLLLTDERGEAARVAGLVGDGVATEVASDEARLWEALARDTFDIVAIGQPRSAAAAIELVASLRRLPDRPDIIVLRSDEHAVERARLLAAGCLAVLNRQLDDPMLGNALGAILARHRDHARRGPLLEVEAEPRLEDFSSQSTPMRKLLDVADRVARADASLLIVGETGVGKEWLARGIHAASGRESGPFVAVNCAAVPETLLESELYGHEKGAFTGADRAHRGHFEMAHKGTLFLDEIGDMAVHLQSKLLRVLQERQIQRIGAERPFAIDVRVIAASNRDLAAAMTARAFRDDLYYRLSVVTLEVPPLRARREDIAPLVHGYLERFARQLGRHRLELRRDALDSLVAYAWPGNVRELINVMERAVLLCTGTAITLDDLPPTVARAGTAPSPGAAPSGPRSRGGEVEFPADWLDLDLREFRRRLLDTTEPSYLAELLARTGGRVGRAAEHAGIDPRSLYDRLRRHGLRKEDFRRPADGDA